MFPGDKKKNISLSSSLPLLSRISTWVLWILDVPCGGETTRRKQINKEGIRPRLNVWRRNAAEYLIVLQNVMLTECRVVMGSLSRRGNRTRFPLNPVREVRRRRKRQRESFIAVLCVGVLRRRIPFLARCERNPFLLLIAWIFYIGIRRSYIFIYLVIIFLALRSLKSQESRLSCHVAYV